MSSLPLQTQKTFVIILRTTGLLSLLGSSWITAEILSDRRNKLKLAYHRFLLGMSLSDAPASLFWFLSSWCVPEGTWWKAAGNAATCKMQAFFTRFTITTALYNASLSLYYLLVLRFGWKDERIRRRVEPVMHFVAISVGLGTSISGLVMDAFGPNGPYCHVKSSQLSPAGGWFVKGLAWYIFSMAIMTCCMIASYVHIRRTEAASNRHYRRTVESCALPPQSQISRRNTGRSKSREFALQGALYVVAFYLTYLFPIVVNIRSIAGKETTSSMTVLYLAHVFFPLQGFFNFYIYLRPRYRNYRKDFPEMPPWKVALRVLRRPFKNNQFRCLSCCSNASISNECDDDGDARLGADLALDSTSRSSRQSSSGTRGSVRGSVGRLLSWSPWARGGQYSEGQGEIVLSSAGEQTREGNSVKEDKDTANGTDHNSCRKRPSASHEHSEDNNHKVGAIDEEDVEIGGRDLAKETKDDWREED